MNQFHEILEKAATTTGLGFDLVQSEKSEACYLKLYPSADHDFHSAITVRLAAHDAMTGRAKIYQTQLDCGFEFNYDEK